MKRAVPFSPKSRRTRARQRGAAMVEGIVVMTTMLVFLGMNVWVGQAYGGKLDQASSTRRDVLFFAAHNCEVRNDEDPDSYTQPQLAGLSGPGLETENADPGIIDGAIDKIGNVIGARTGGGEANAVKRDWMTASAGKGPTAVGGAAIVNTTPERGITLAKVGLSTRLATSSYATCNEKRYDNPWTQIFDLGFGFLKSAAGGG